MNWTIEGENDEMEDRAVLRTDDGELLGYVEHHPGNSLRYRGVLLVDGVEQVGHEDFAPFEVMGWVAERAFREGRGFPTIPQLEAVLKAAELVLGRRRDATLAAAERVALQLAVDACRHQPPPPPDASAAPETTP